ncbi:uncharacterized protein LOC142629285 isoform X2 [Castanea sativa]|uniref:uncharacterized protein LOC142629285 isoform X2 n=1 Tax=Castanea sativa TaxID=21020 RepID=UPI003F64BF5C
MPWAIWINNHAMELSNSTINNIRWDPPSMAQHPESMVEIHPRPTTPAFTGSKDIEHLRGSLAIRPLRNITGPTRKGASSSGNLSEKVSHGRDNRGFDSRDPFAAQAHPNSIIHGELHLGVSHEADASAIAGTCHHPSRESSDAQRGIEAGVMEMDDIQEGLCPGILALVALELVKSSVRCPMTEYTQLIPLAMREEFGSYGAGTWMCSLPRNRRYML